MTTKPRRRRGPRGLESALFEIARREGGERFRRVLVHAAAVRALGPMLARRLDATELDGARVTLVVAGAATAREVERHSGMLRERLRRALREPGLELAVRAAPERDPPPRRAPAEPAPAKPLTSRALEDVEDPALRARLARWARLPPRP